MSTYAVSFLILGCHFLRSLALSLSLCFSSFSFCSIKCFLFPVDIVCSILYLSKASTNCCLNFILCWTSTTCGIISSNHTISTRSLSLRLFFFYLRPQTYTNVFASFISLLFAGEADSILVYDEIEKKNQHHRQKSVTHTKKCKQNNWKTYAFGEIGVHVFKNHRNCCVQNVQPHTAAHHFDKAEIAQPVLKLRIFNRANATNPFGVDVDCRLESYQHS